MILCNKLNYVLGKDFDDAKNTLNDIIERGENYSIINNFDDRIVVNIDGEMYIAIKFSRHFKEYINNADKLIISKNIGPRTKELILVMATQQGGIEKEVIKEGLTKEEKIKLLDNIEIDILSDSITKDLAKELLLKVDIKRNLELIAVLDEEKFINHEFEDSNKRSWFIDYYIEEKNSITDNKVKDVVNFLKSDYNHDKSEYIDYQVIEDHVAVLYY